MPRPAMEEGLAPSPRPGSEAGRTNTLTDASDPQPQEGDAEEDPPEAHHLLPHHIRVKSTSTAAEERDDRGGKREEEPRITKEME